MIRREGDVRLVVAAVVLLAAAIATQVARDRWFPREEREHARMLYVRSGEAMKRIALSFDALAADVYWIRAIQHYGGDRLAGTARKRKYELLHPMLDLTTTLDPYFRIAYLFGSIYLSEGYPGGPGRPDQAITLLRKGIAVSPTKWEYYYYVAMVYYWHLRDMEAAAHWLRLAASQPKAPTWLEPQAAAFLTVGGEHESSRLLWNEILKSEEPWLQQSARRGLLQLDALDQIAVLQPLVYRFPPPAGERYSWDWLMRRRVLRGLPRDPTGTPYDIDPGSGVITVSNDSQLFPMPKPMTLH